MHHFLKYKQSLLNNVLNYLVFLRISKASSLDFGLLINSLFKETTLSALITSLSGFLLLTLIDLISAKFFETIKGSAPFAKKNF